jgi:hypothetical protein
VLAAGIEEIPMSLSLFLMHFKGRPTWKRPQESEQPSEFLLFCGWEKPYMPLGEKVCWVNEKIGHEKVGVGADELPSLGKSEEKAGTL